MSALEVIVLTKQLERRDDRIAKLEKVIYSAAKVYSAEEEDDNALPNTEQLWRELGEALQSIDLDFDLELFCANRE